MANVIEQLRSLVILELLSTLGLTIKLIGLHKHQELNNDEVHKIELQKSSTIICCPLIFIVLVSFPYRYCVNAQSWITYTDPNGKYTLQLPPELKPSAPYPEESRPLVLKFVSIERPGMAQIIISVVTASNKNLNITLDNLKDIYLWLLIVKLTYFPYFRRTYLLQI